MANKLFLPQLNSNRSSLPDPAQDGHWAANAPGVLGKIAQGIEVDEKAKSRGVSSVPDIWARALLFQSALEQRNKHPLRKDLLKEWRGLLSLIALSRLRDKHEIDILPVPLRGEVFAQALETLAPPAVKLEANKEYPWTDIFLIRYRPNGIASKEAIPLGALSPTTLVFTSSSYSARLRNYPAPFHKDGVLRPPQERESRELVFQWLEQVRDKLGNVLAGDHSPNHEITLGINELLAEWSRELQSEIEGGSRGSAAIELDEQIVRGGLPRLSEYSVYRELLHPLKLEGKSSEKVSDILLSPRVLSQRNRLGVTNVVLISPYTIGRDVKVWKTVRSADLGGPDDPDVAVARHFGSAASGQGILNSDLASDNSLWVRPELYFLSETLLENKEVAAPLLPSEEGEANLGTQFILPFQRSILDFFSPKAVIDDLDPRYEISDSAVTFRFRLPVGEGDEFVPVEKTYRRVGPRPGEGRVQQIKPPVVALYPNYLNREWRRYYLYQSGVDTVVARPIIARGETIERRRESSITTMIYGDDAFPEAVALQTAASKSSGTTQESSNDLGLVLLQRPAEPAGLEKKLRVGIDFGTSNTNIYLKPEDGGLAEKWTFAFTERLRKVLAFSNDEAQEILEDEFVPLRNITLPTPTSLRIFQLAQKSQPLLDYSVYFSRGLSVPENVFSDIKWNELEKKTILFLESLLVFVLIEVVARRASGLELCCSFPKAFTDAEEGTFKAEWKAALKELVDPGQEKEQRVINTKSGAEGDDSLKPEVIEEPHFGNEGHASGYFFANIQTFAKDEDKALIGTGAICLDVGGATTDISVWTDDRIVADASILLAGRQFASILQDSAVLRELLFSPEAARALQAKVGDPAGFAARLNLILGDPTLDVGTSLIRHSNKPEIQWLRRLLAIEFGAIVFYAATLVTADLKRRKSEGEPEGNGFGGSQLHMHWGGNAAKLMNWIDLGKPSNDGIGTELMKALLYNGLKDGGLRVKSDLLGQKHSPDHKCEVAGGLVVMDFDSKDKPKPPSQSTSSAMPGDDGEADEIDALDADDQMKVSAEGKVCLMGENIELSTGEGGFDQFVPLNAIYPGQGGTTFRRTTFERLDRFVDVLNLFGVRKGLFTEDTVIEVPPARRAYMGDLIKGVFKKEARLRDSERRNEPVFIMEVRLLMEEFGRAFSRNTM